jgi:glucosamine kinase
MRAAAIAAPGLSIFGAVLGEGRSGTANARIGIKALYDTLKDTADQAITQAGLDAGQRARIRAGMGIAGISRPGIREALEQLDFGFAHRLCQRFADRQSGRAWRGRRGDPDHRHRQRGAIARGGGFTIGGYGFPISDEGSGAALGLSAMRHALRALDGRTRKTPLSTAVTEKFGHDTARAVAWMDEATPRDYGAFARW